MAILRLRAAEGPAPALRRMVRESLGEIQDWLQPDEGGIAADRLRDARRRLKRVRAAARLLRLLDPKNARALNAACRDAGRALSEARDADAVQAMASALCEDEPNPLARQAFHQLSGTHGEGAARPAPSYKTARKALRLAEKAAKRLPKKQKAADAVNRSLARIDARERAAFAAAQVAGEDEEPRHEWRKRLKDRLFAVRMLRDAAVLDRADERRRAKALGALLGADRDLLLVAERLQAGAVCDQRAASAALASIARRRGAVQRQAARLGRQIEG